MPMSQEELDDFNKSLIELEEEKKTPLITALEEFLAALDKIIGIATDRKMLIAFNSLKSYVEKKIAEEWTAIPLSDKL